MHKFPLKVLDQNVLHFEFPLVLSCKFSLVGFDLLHFLAEIVNLRSTDPSMLAYFPLKTENSTTKSTKVVVLAIRAAGAWLRICKVAKGSF